MNSSRDQQKNADQCALCSIHLRITCFLSLTLDLLFLFCFFFPCLPFLGYPHTHSCTLCFASTPQTGDRRQEGEVSGTTFFLESRNGSEVQIWTRASPWRWSRNKLVSVIAKAWASLLTVTLTSVLHRAKQIRLSAAVIRLIMSQRQHCVYVPLQQDHVSVLSRFKTDWKGTSWCWHIVY